MDYKVFGTSKRINASAQNADRMFANTVAPNAGNALSKNPNVRCKMPPRRRLCYSMDSNFRSGDKNALFDVGTACPESKIAWAIGCIVCGIIGIRQLFTSEKVW